jgi:Na+-driven multidrug efflux pump
MHVSRRRLWWNRFARFGAGSVGPLAIAAAGVVRNKWLAIHLETAGIGIVAQTFAAHAWIGAVAGLGLGLPVTRAVAAAVGARDAEAARRVVWTAFALVAVATVPIAAAVLLFAEPLAHLLLGDRALAALLRISVVGVLGVALFPVVQGLLAGRSDVRATLGFGVVGGGTATLLTLLLVPRFGLEGAVWAVAALYPAAVVAMLVWHVRTHREALGPRPAALLDRETARALLVTAGATFAIPLIDQGALLALRAHYLHEHGAGANGLLQAALAVSQQAGAPFYAYLSAYALGKITAAGASEGRPAVEAYTRKQWAPIVALAAALLAIAMLGAAPLLRLLYSSRFDPARAMMAYAIVGEFGRVCIQAAALGSLPLGGAALWFRIGILQPLTLAAAYPCFVAAGAGPMSLPRAYAAAAAVTFVAGAWMMARAGVALRPRDAAVAAAGYALLLALLAATV